MTDYWLSKLFFDLQNPAFASEYRKDRETILARYPLSSDVLSAISADDVAYLAPRVNPYLLRYYFQTIQMPDDMFISKLRGLSPTQRGPSHG